jgi:hypothetical protein
LLVHGFDRATAGNTYDYVKYHAPELVAVGASVSSCANDAVVDGLFNLSGYQFVDYILGDESTVNETFSTAEQALVSAYLKGGGKLLASGAEIAWDIDYKGSTTDKDFCYNFLKMQYVADAPNGVAGSVYQANGLVEPFISYGPIMYDNGTHGTINVQYPDVVKAINGSTGPVGYNTVLPTTGVAAVVFKGTFPSGTQEGGVFVIGFPLESVYDPIIRKKFMADIVRTFFPYADVNDAGSVPNAFSLSQNYPNPFNPATRIKYQTPRSQGTKSAGGGIEKSGAGFVSLKVFDALGNEVATLVNQEQPPGEHEVIFNASNLPSGVYFYQLKAGGKADAKKMILLR